MCYKQYNIIFSFFFFNDTATTEIYTLSLHDALPIYHKVHDDDWTPLPTAPAADTTPRHLHPPSTAATLNLAAVGDRKSTRLNSSHVEISYAVFCLKKKKK